MHIGTWTFCEHDIRMSQCVYVHMYTTASSPCRPSYLRGCIVNTKYKVCGRARLVQDTGACHGAE